LLLAPLFNFLFLLAGAGGDKDNKVLVVVNEGSKDNNDGEEENNDDVEDNNDDNNVSLLSVSFSII